MNFIHNDNQIAMYEKGEKLLAEVTFPYTDETKTIVNVDHTFVDDSLRGQGIAGKLMDELVRDMNYRHLKAVLTCPYAVKWFEKHPEYSHLLA